MIGAGNSAQPCKKCARITATTTRTMQHHWPTCSKNSQRPMPFAHSVMHQSPQPRRHIRSRKQSTCFRILCKQRATTSLHTPSTLTATHPTVPRRVKSVTNREIAVVDAAGRSPLLRESTKTALGAKNSNVAAGIPTYLTRSASGIKSTRVSVLNGFAKRWRSRTRVDTNFLRRWAAIVPIRRTNDGVGVQRRSSG